MISLLVALVSLRPMPFHVDGSLLIDELGREVALRGFTIAGFESGDGGANAYRSVRVAMEDWHANCLRIPVSQDRWLGKLEAVKDKGAAYREAIDEIITYTTNRKGYAILELASSDAGTWGKNVGPHDLPDENSLKFWTDVAVRYRGLNHLLFGIYSAPRTSDWNTWKFGGAIQEGSITYKSPGIQAIIDAIRKARAQNVCVIGGCNSATDLSGLSSVHGLADPQGSGLIYDIHMPLAASRWSITIGGLPKDVPILFGEVIPATDSSNLVSPGTFIDALHATKMSWTGFTFGPGAKPSLVNDWIYTPTTDWGVAIKAALAN